MNAMSRSKPMEHKKDHSARKNDPFLFYRAGVQRVQPYDGLLRQSLDARCRSKTPTGMQGQSPAGSKAKPGPVRMSLRHTVLGIPYRSG